MLRLLIVTVAVLALAFLAHPKAPAVVPEPHPVASGQVSSIQVTTVGEMRDTAEWFDLLFRSTAQDNEPAARLGLEPPRSEADDRPKRSSTTYRTICVRLCDGFHFPISHSTSREGFAGDAKQCEQRCPTRSRLFVHRSSGQDVKDSVDLKGRFYRDLPTALLHRTQYVPDCTCRGNPWDAAALARHRAYADSAKQKQSNKTAAQLPLSGAEVRLRSRGPVSTP